MKTPCKLIFRIILASQLLNTSARGETEEARVHAEAKASNADETAAKEQAEQKRHSEEVAAQKVVAEKAKAAAEIAALPQISASDLHKEYDQNEIAADAKWKGKIVIVAGSIHSIGKDFLGNAFVVLSWDKYGFQNVRCDFGDSMEALKSLKKGDRVKIKGCVSGFIMHDVQIEKSDLVR